MRLAPEAGEGLRFTVGRRDLRIPPVVRAVAVASLAGAADGIVAGGIGGRIAMRVSSLMTERSLQGTLTEAGNRVGEITFGGTMSLVLFGGAFIGVFGGLIYLGVKRWLADLGSWRGLGIGLLLLIGFGWIIITGDNFDFSRFGPPLLNIAMFALIFIAFGLLMVPFHDVIERIMTRPSRGLSAVTSLGAYGLGLVLALVIALMLVRFGGFGAGLRQVLSTVVLAYAIIVMPVSGLLISRAAGGFAGLTDLSGRRRWLVIAVVVLALPVGLGVVLDALAVTDILRSAP